MCDAVRVGVIYLLSGIGGSILSSLFIQNSISVGASGALFGLLGAMLSELLTNWTIYANKVYSQLLVFAVLLPLHIKPFSIGRRAIFLRLRSSYRIVETQA